MLVPQCPINISGAKCNLCESSTKLRFHSVKSLQSIATICSQQLTRELHCKATKEKLNKQLSKFSDNEISSDGKFVFVEKISDKMKSIRNFSVRAF